MAVSTLQAATYSVIILWLLGAVVLSTGGSSQGRGAQDARPASLGAATPAPIPNDGVREIPAEGEYVSFEPWNGGWNNRRMGLELAYLMAYVLNRTLVLPPVTKAVLTPGETAFTDYYSIRQMRRFIRVLTYEEFSRIAPRLPPAQGAPPRDQTSDIKHHCATLLKRPIPRMFCERSAQARRKAKQMKWVFISSIFNIDGVAEDDADYVAYRRKRREVDLFGSVKGSYWIHFPQNMFGLYYQTFYFKEKESRRAAFRAVRDGLKLHSSLEDLADRIVEALFGGRAFNAVHYRRGDFKGQFNQAFISPERLLANYKGHVGGEDALPVYLATDEKSPEVLRMIKAEIGATVYTFNDAKEKVPEIADLVQLHGILETLVCVRSRMFTGTKLSTFSAYITRLRGYTKGKPIDKQIYYTDTSYAPGEVLHEAQPYSWSPTEGQTKLGDFRGLRPTWMREYPESWVKLG
eukprot:TRINITY_DN94_c1_g2_i1.p1 TRINITY_DN94_c1_g2~~TRINITY_DN94_c1_g2_i1.p1  ORF type:complete len:463 (+),score=128.76 TRINITY_DN94_c1_g2_i1:307-1695(+)